MDALFAAAWVDCRSRSNLASQAFLPFNMHAMSATLVSHTQKWLHFNCIPLSVILGFQSSPVISDSPLRQHYCHTEVLSHVFSWHNCNCCIATSKVPHVTSTTGNFLANIVNTCWSDHITTWHKNPMATSCSFLSLAVCAVKHGECFLSIFLSTSRSYSCYS